MAMASLSDKYKKFEELVEEEEESQEQLALKKNVTRYDDGEGTSSHFKYSLHVC